MDLGNEINWVVYTGTHDTNTVTGRFNESSKEDKEFVSSYIGREIGPEANWDYIRIAMMSLSNRHRPDAGCAGNRGLNCPGKAEGHWMWRFKEDQYRMHALRLAEMARRYGRAR